MRSIALLTVAALLLAGCSGNGGEDTDSPAAASSSSTTTTGPPPKPVPVTDTLHFLAAPAMTPVSADLGAEVASPVTTGNFGGGGGGGGNQEEGAHWAHQVTAATEVTSGSVHIWVEIKETMFDSRVEPLQPQCTWRLSVEVGADSPVVACINEPAGPIAAGTKELVFDLAFDGAIDMEVNETITVRLQRTAFSLSANNAVDALSGSADHDSYIQLTGLKEPAVSIRA